MSLKSLLPILNTDLKTEVEIAAISVTNNLDYYLDHYHINLPDEKQLKIAEFIVQEVLDHVNNS